MLLEGQSALITGGGRGIGKAIALAFARQGCDIAAAARTSGEVEAAAREVRGLGRKAVALTCDVADPKAVSAMVDATLDAFGKIDILVNNAGHACFKPFMELTPGEWQHTLDVNLTGPALCIQAVAPSMMER